jgi:hypothetical protein
MNILAITIHYKLKGFKMHFGYLEQALKVSG